MADRRVLVDTSVWIHLFRPRPSAGLSKQVAILNEAGRLVSAGPVRMELLQGVGAGHAYNLIRQQLNDIPELPLTADLWERAGELGYRLRRRGTPIAGMDLLIATLAMANDCALLHLDKDFDRIKRVSPLVVEPPAASFTS